MLPWSKLADMLQAKIRNISTRELTEGDLAHLRERLLSMGSDGCSSWSCILVSFKYSTIK